MMTYKGKRNIVGMLGGMIALFGYFFFATGANAPASNDLKSWAIVILAFIGVLAFSQIVIQILFHIFYAVSFAAGMKESDDKKINGEMDSLMKEDEMDQLIYLKSIHLGYVFTGIGFMVFFLALALGTLPIIALHILLGTFVVSAGIAGAARIYFYEMGM